ncbi:hypothetical protein VCUG_01486 [Vavraia culicis subsp. floridensis]|uniref:Secreted protein n=1 Tax=Vavraia culicis (isolate floridensis) TaxID=948595 RepID=L2GTP8_VAVCU|nr:uncharacterized protein VCUG_01486 [Vavraia culicis subsp. floridensis]ELA47041.1 hypothetical protein VCUG_01486 [Vavraia culicis subsp. floridensis]
MHNMQDPVNGILVLLYSWWLTLRSIAGGSSFCACRGRIQRLHSKSFFHDRYQTRSKFLWHKHMKYHISTLKYSFILSLSTTISFKLHQFCLLALSAISKPYFPSVFKKF